MRFTVECRASSSTMIVSGANASSSKRVRMGRLFMAASCGLLDKSTRQVFDPNRLDPEGTGNTLIDHDREVARIARRRQRPAGLVEHGLQLLADLAADLRRRRGA